MHFNCSPINFTSMIRFYPVIHGIWHQTVFSKIIKSVVKEVIDIQGLKPYDLQPLIQRGPRQQQVAFLAPSHPAPRAQMSRLRLRSNQQPTNPAKLLRWGHTVQPFCRNKYPLVVTCLCAPSALCIFSGKNIQNEKKRRSQKDHFHWGKCLISWCIDSHMKFNSSDKYDSMATNGKVYEKGERISNPTQWATNRLLPFYI